MALGLEKIGLRESHLLHVMVRDGSQQFAGELRLSSEQVTLKVMGEEFADRRCTIRWSDLESLTCRHLNSEFLLLGLTCTRSLGSLLECSQGSRSYFEVHFEAENALYFPHGMCGAPLFIGIQLRFDVLASWLGNTQNQEKIIREYASGSKVLEKSELFNEFSVQVGEEGVLGVNYHPRLHYSSPEFSAGIDFPPFLYLAFSHEKIAAQAIQVFTELRALFEFLTGGEIDLDEVIFLAHGIGPLSSAISLFYPTAKYPPRSRNSLVLYPLGQGLRFDTLGLPAFPVESFDAYFCLPKSERAYFHKYVRYRRLNSAEERFLGYFRILESICRKVGSYLDSELLDQLAERAKPFFFKYFGDQKAVKAFLNRLPSFNNSKYNTERCIGDFFETIPGALSSGWVYQKKDIARICKLRNDISHANDYQVSESEIEKMSRFCEVLVVLTLLLKLGISMDSAIAVIGRVDGCFLITRQKA